MTTIRRVFSLLLLGTTIVSASLITAPTAEAKHCYAKGQRHAINKYNHCQAKSTRKWVKKNNAANRRCVRRTNTAIKQYNRHH